MDKYCPECKMNFSDSFDECVYCGGKLLYGSIEIEENYEEKDILKMTNEAILKKYNSYRKHIEEETGVKLSDKEFIDGLKKGRRESLIRQSNEYFNNKENISEFSVICPYCNSINVKKITFISKATHTALFGFFSISKIVKIFIANNVAQIFKN